MPKKRVGVSEGKAKAWQPLERRMAIKRPKKNKKSQEKHSANSASKEKRIKSKRTVKIRSEKV